MVATVESEQRLALELEGMYNGSQSATKDHLPAEGRRVGREVVVDMMEHRDLGSEQSILVKNQKVAARSIHAGGDSLAPLWVCCSRREVMDYEVEESGHDPVTNRFGMVDDHSCRADRKGRGVPTEAVVRDCRETKNIRR